MTRKKFQTTENRKKLLQILDGDSINDNDECQLVPTYNDKNIENITTDICLLSITQKNYTDDYVEHFVPQNILETPKLKFKLTKIGAPSRLNMIPYFPFTDPNEDDILKRLNHTVVARASHIKEKLISQRIQELTEESFVENVNLKMSVACLKLYASSLMEIVEVNQIDVEDTYESYQLSPTIVNQGAIEYIPVTIPKQKKKDFIKEPVMKIPDQNKTAAGKARKKTETTRKALSERKSKKLEL